MIVDSENVDEFYAEKKKSWFFSFKGVINNEYKNRKR